jgi:hypothetical protein
LTAIITRELSHRILDAPLILLRLANHCRFPFFHEANPQGRVVGRRLELAAIGITRRTLQRHNPLFSACNEFRLVEARLRSNIEPFRKELTQAQRPV